MLAMCYYAHMMVFCIVDRMTPLLLRVFWIPSAGKDFAFYHDNISQTLAITGNRK